MFNFGENWKNFLKNFDISRLNEAKKDIQNFLGTQNLSNKSFLDVGSGSGLSSLAARSLGAKVLSFDYNLDSVKCTQSLKLKFFNNDQNWKILKGNVLDINFIKSLGKFDIVYAWGVLHHTGNQWKSLRNLMCTCKSGTLLHLALYNDQGLESKRWLDIKKRYQKIPNFLKTLYVFYIYFPSEFKNFMYFFKIGQPSLYFKKIINYKKSRGMSYFYDMIDWVGGYPFEVSTPQKVIIFLKKNNFLIKKIIKNTGYGNNIYLAKKL
jgi:2-polyprenyl-6-hydroxyphenyl methylase/3-demethylubiquinone-9 3-methyltransferase